MMTAQETLTLIAVMAAVLLVAYAIAGALS